MPCFIIAHGSVGTGQAFAATLCDSGPSGEPARRTAVPIKVRIINDQMLAVDDEPRSIVSTVGENGVTTFLVDDSSACVRNRERSATLERASALLQQLRNCLKPLTAESEEPWLAVEGLGLLFDWITEERERLSAVPRSTDDGDRNHAQ